MVLWVSPSGTRRVLSRSDVELTVQQWHPSRRELYLRRPNQLIRAVRYILGPCPLQSKSYSDDLEPLLTATQGQYTDGLRTPLIIHPPNETYSYDGDYTINLGDWYHDSFAVLMTQFISISNPGGAEPVPSTYSRRVLLVHDADNWDTEAPLMYFSQNGQYLPPKEGSQTSGAASATGFNENATISFEPGKTYRLRIVNSGAFAGFYFWIDDHEMRIIEADGVETEPYTVNQINIGVAQRYSVLVTAKNDTSSNYAMHAHFDTDMFDTVPADQATSAWNAKLASYPVTVYTS